MITNKVQERQKWIWCYRKTICEKLFKMEGGVNISSAEHNIYTVM